MFDSLGADQSCLYQNFQMFTGGWLADAEFSCDQQAADAVFNEVAVDLRGKVFFGLAQPVEDLKAAGVGEGAECERKSHIGSWLSG